MLAQTAHVPGVHLTSFTIPGGNGYNDLEVLANDPLGWVQSEINKRTAPAESDASGSGIIDKITDPNSVMGRDLSKPIKDAVGGKLADVGRGLVVAGAMLLLAVLLIILGVYQFTKD